MTGRGAIFHALSATPAVGARWRKKQLDVTAEAPPRRAVRGVVPSPANPISPQGLMVRKALLRRTCPLGPGGFVHQVRFHTALLVVSPVVRRRGWEWACLAEIGDAVRQQILTRQESGGGCLGVGG